MREWLLTWSAAFPEQAIAFAGMAAFAVLAVVASVAAHREWQRALADESRSPDWTREGGMPRC